VTEIREEICSSWQFRSSRILENSCDLLRAATSDRQFKSGVFMRDFEIIQVVRQRMAMVAFKTFYKLHSLC